MTHLRSWSRSRAVLVAAGLVASAGAAVGLTSPQAVARPASVVALPQFQLDPDFLKPLPNAWILSPVAEVAIGPGDHVCLLTRPRFLPPDQQPRAAPAVLEFDRDGHFLQAWGGPSPRYQWPAMEHAIGIDPKGFVWIGGNAGDGSGVLRAPDDDILLKFTTDGTFVKQIGRQNESKGNVDTANVKEPTMVAFHRNEAYVSDGYGNRRVIVFDADTMAFRRKWGAFGNTPKDGPKTDGVREPGWDPGPLQFGLPHALAISNDGRVYVADRPNRRVQAFTREGAFLSQVVVPGGPHPAAAADGPGAVALSADPQQQFLYIGDPKAELDQTIVIVDRRTMKILGRFGQKEIAFPHEIATDSRGNLYVAAGTPMLRFILKGRPAETR